VLSNRHEDPEGPSRWVIRECAAVAGPPHFLFEPLEGPEGFTVRAFFCFWCHMRMTRDWWAVLLAALAAVLVKFGVVSGVPW